MKSQKLPNENLTDNQTYDLLFKKQKLIHLSETQKGIADETIPYILEKGRVDLIETQFKLSFNTPKKVEAFLTYTNYKICDWAIEHYDYKLMQHILDKTTVRSKFLIVSHNNYELIKKFVDFNIQKIQDHNYEINSAIEILKALIKDNPNSLDDILEHTKKFIDEKSLNFLEASYFKEELNKIFPQLADEANEKQEVTLVFDSIPNNYNTKLEHELAGDHSYVNISDDYQTHV